MVDNAQRAVAVLGPPAIALMHSAFGYRQFSDGLVRAESFRVPNYLLVGQPGSRGIYVQAAKTLAKADRDDGELMIHGGAVDGDA